MDLSYKKTHQIDRISKKYLPLLIIFQCYAPIVSRFQVGKLYQLYQYGIYGLLAIYSFCYFWVHRGKLVHKFPQVSAMFIFMFFYVVAACVKLFYVPSSIFFYLRLVTFCSFLSVGVIFLFMQNGVIKRTFRLWWRFVPWITILSVPFGVASYKIMVLFMLFFFVVLSDCLRPQLRYLTYALLLYVVMFCIIQRMDYLFIIAPLTILFMIKYNLFMSLGKSIFLYHVLMWIPVVFLCLAMFTGFNVLNFESYVEGEYTSNTGENMKTDTRTFLYEEAIESALDNKYVLLGRTPGYGYDSHFVATGKNSYDHVEGAKPQRCSEVFVVNIFTWCGLIGVLVWFAFYYWFGVSVLKDSRNRYVRGLVIYIGMLWVFNWIHNPSIAPDNYNMLIYIIISICIQKEFCKMNDLEISQHFKRMLR